MEIIKNNNGKYKFNLIIYINLLGTEIFPLKSTFIVTVKPSIYWMYILRRVAKFVSCQYTG